MSLVFTEMKKKLLIPTVSALSLSLGGCSDDGDSRDAYERACEKFKRCDPASFSPAGGDEYFYTSIDDCAATLRAYVQESVRYYSDYATSEECYTSMLDLYECYYAAYADVEACVFADEEYAGCADEYAQYLRACE
jgi:hypothetical protein